MREIKFRAWDKTRKVMSPPPSMEIYDFLIYHNSQMSLIPREEFNCDMVFMQYTGLKDKNSKEIYEGDIVKVLYKDITCLKNKEVIGDVCWDEETASWFIENYDYAFFYGEKEVVGNIYENPELIEDK